MPALTSEVSCSGQCGSREWEREGLKSGGSQRLCRRPAPQHLPTTKMTGIQQVEAQPRHALTRGRLRSPDLDGGAVQDLPVTVPGAPGDGTAAGGVLTAGLPKPLLPPRTGVAVLILQVLRHKLEFLDTINFNKSEVELARERGGRR